MQQKGAYIHVFSLFNTAYFVYDVNTDCIIKIDKDTYNILKRHSNEKNKQIIEMEQGGFLNHKRVNIIEHPEDKVIESHLNSKIQSITLQVTQNCNLNCSYCAYSGSYDNRVHNNKRMDFKVAKKGIDFLVNHSAQNYKINIGFYGGEPLLEFKLIKELITYAQTRINYKDITFSITTNGTLLNDEIIRFFADNKVSLVISLDGPKEIHDSNRIFKDGSGSYEIIIRNIKKIKADFPEYFKKIYYNTVLSPYSNFSCIADYYMNFDLLEKPNFNANFISNFYLKKEIKYSNEFIKNYNYELFKMFMSKLNYLDEKQVSDIAKQYYNQLKLQFYHNRDIKSIPEKVHHSGPCLPGVFKLFMDVEGKFYPCERVSESSNVMSIGHVDKGFDMEKIRDILNIGKITEEECKNCWAIRHCYLCAASADDLKEFSVNKKRKNCASVKIETENKMKDYCALKLLGHKFS